MINQCKDWYDKNGQDRSKENEIWKSIVENYDVLVRYDLSLNDIDCLRDDMGVATLYYPPTPEMKYIKMWPPYEEVIKNAEQ